MVKGVVNFSGEKLTEARLANGHYKNALAEMIDVTPMAITRYEANQDKPTYDKLVAIAGTLKFPIDFFIRKPWPENLGPVFWRTRNSETKLSREMTEQRMKWLCELFWTMEEELEFPPVSLPDLKVPEDFRLISPTMIEHYATEVRNHWKLRDLPVKDVVLSVENAGIPVVMLNIPSEKQDGFFFRSPLLKRGFIGINVHNATAARARFDAAHELGHLLLHKWATSEQERDPASHKLLEQQAHRFAGAFLFPKDRFFREVSEPSLDCFRDLKMRWGMSIAAMISRASDLDLIGKDDKAQLFISMNRRKWRGLQREPLDDVLPLERPRMLRRGLEALVSSGDYSPDFLEHFLSLPRYEVGQLLGVSDEMFSDDLSQRGARVFRRGNALEATDLETGQLIRFPRRSGD
jgi:Zn-dependent peptidase ImmA (M78 family)/transcriptional regulator with XRE-family HTH domain